MTVVKKCPSCQKELSITAINCKYCGEDLEPSSTKSFFDVPGQNSPVPAPMSKPALPARPMSPSKIPAAPRPAAVVDDWIPEAEHSKLIDLSDLSSLAAKVSPPAKAPPPTTTPVAVAVPQEKTEIMAYPDMILRANADALETVENESEKEVSGLMEVSGLIEVKEDISDDEIEDVDAEPSVAASIPVEIPASVPAAISVPLPSAPARKPVEGDDDWIPESEPSALIDLSEHSNVVAVLMPGAAKPAPVVEPLPTPVVEAIPVPSVEPKPTPAVEPPPASVPVPRPSIPLPRPSIPAPAPAAVPERDEKTGGFHFSTRAIILISAGVFILTLGLALIVMVLSQDTEDGDDEREVVEVVEVTPGGESAPASSSDKKNNDVAKPSAEQKVESVVTSIPATGTNCGELAALDERFPWREVLEKIAGGTARSKICEWFGVSSSVLVGALPGVAAVGPTGSDWISDGGRFEVYPGGTVGAREPSIEFLFAGNKLYKISLRFRDAKVAKKTKAEQLEKNFTRKSEGTDAVGRDVVRFADGDLNVQWIEEEWYGRKLKTVIFSSRQIDDAMAAVEKERAEVEVIFNAAEALYATWKFDDAQKKYEEVISRMAGFGPALNRLGLILSRKENFAGAAELANKALRMTREDQVKADANTILAMAALFSGDTVGALKFLKAASDILPSDAVYKDYVKELEAGIFSDSRLAKTAARMECLKEGKSEGTEKGILARGNFPNKMVYLEQMVDHGKGRAFDKIKKSYKAWECP